MHAPKRFVNVEPARRTFGDRVDRLAPFLLKADPPADEAVAALTRLDGDAAWRMVSRAAEHGVASVPEAPPAMRALFDAVEYVPAWVDWDTLDRRCAVLLRAGALGGMVLGAKSLVFGYAAPAGNKPLVLSGQLAQRASRRLNETARFVQAVCRPGGLRPGADGYAIALKVRLMHARVRQMIARSGRWDTDAWGVPINQHDMAATSMLFSSVVLEGLEQLGMRIRASEADDYMQLWRYASHVLGVEPELVPTSVTEARRLMELIAATQERPDDDSRALVRALMEAGLTQARTPAERTMAERRMHFGHALCRELVGDALADDLAVGRTRFSLAIPVLKRIVRATERVRGSVRFADAQAIASGERYWKRVVEIGLAGATAEFRWPERLAA